MLIPRLMKLYAVLVSSDNPFKLSFQLVIFQSLNHSLLGCLNRQQKIPNFECFYECHILPCIVKFSFEENLPQLHYGTPHWSHLWGNIVDTHLTTAMIRFKRSLITLHHIAVVRQFHPISSKLFTEGSIWDFETPSISSHKMTFIIFIHILLAQTRTTFLPKNLWRGNVKFMAL